MHGYNIKNVRNFYMYLNNGAVDISYTERLERESTASWPI